MWNARLDESQAGVHIAGRNIKGLRYADDTAPMAASEGPPDGSERGEWKSWLKTQHSKNEDHGIWSHLFMANRWGNNGKIDRLYFGGAPKSLPMVTAVTKLKEFSSPWEKSYDKPRQHIKKQRHHFTNKGPCSQSYGFSSGHVWMWELDHKEGWTLKN